MKPQSYYDADYYDNKLAKKGYGVHGLVYDKGCAPFMDLAIILRSICRPRIVTDYGCAKGLLVAELRNIGIEARGYDFSAYAISHADSEIRKYLEQRDLCDEYEYPKCDLAICMDTLEHIDIDKIPGVLSRIYKSCDEYVFTMCGLSTNPDDAQANHEDHVTLRTYDEWVSILTESGEFRLSDKNEKLAVALFDVDSNKQAAENWGLKSILLDRAR